MLRPLEILFLCSFAFLAGLVDSIVGGGGLIQLPALFVFLPRSTPIPMIMGTNKLAAVCGTSTALVQYAKRVRLPWASVLPAAATAALFSVMGARTVEHLDKANSEWLRPFVLVLLILVLLFLGVGSWSLRLQLRLLRRQWCQRRISQRLAVIPELWFDLGWLDSP